MRLRTAAFGLLLTLFANQAAVFAQSSDAFANWLNGADGYERALDKRRGTSDAILVYFYTDWCPYCRRFDKEIASSPQMADYLRHAVAVRINPEKGEREKKLAAQFQANGYPSIFVIPTGTEQPQKITASRDNPAPFIAACEAAASRRQVKQSSSPTHQAASPRAVSSQPKAVVSPQQTQAAEKPASRRVKNRVYLKNGNVVVGLVQEADDQEIVVEVDAVGSLTLKRSEILRIVGDMPSPEN